MKVYLLDVYDRGPRYFLDEKELISYLNNDDKRGNLIHKYTIKVIEAEVLEQATGKDYLETYIKVTSEKNIRESKLNAVLGDAYSIAVEKLISYIKENAPENIVKQKFLEQIQLVPVEKKQLSKFIAKKGNYLLYEVSNKVEYYQMLLAVHNFRNMEDRYYALRYDSFGKEYFEGGWTKPINKNNFLKAKSSK